MKVAVASVPRMAEETACLRLKFMVWSLKMAWRTKKPVNWDDMSAGSYGRVQGPGHSRLVSSWRSRPLVCLGALDCELLNCSITQS